MPKPIFDINQYELRGTTPPVFSAAQKKRLAEVLSRANGQIDWTAQLLGFNGPNYWGLSNPKSDGSYNWEGLPNTMNQKRQLQATTFGVYSKDKEYASRPAPFNRSEINASGDASFHIWEAGGKTQISPLGQGKLLTYGAPEVFVGGQYIFDQRVEFSFEGEEAETLYWSFFNNEDREWTRMVLKQTEGLIKVNIKDSLAEPAYLQPKAWRDISDWTSLEVTNQFIGLWGNKGNALSFDAAFDALELHGFNERDALGFSDTDSCLTPGELLGKIGLKSTPWTKFYNTKFGLQIGDCPVVYPLPAADIEDNYTYYSCEDCNSVVELSQTQTPQFNPENDLYNNAEYSAGLPAPVCLISNGVYDTSPPEEYQCEQADEGEYDRLIENAVPCTGGDFTVKGIKELCITYTPKTECGLIEFPCIEFVFDPTLDDGTYPIEAYCAENPGPWMVADDGIYDEVTSCFVGASQTDLRCVPGVFCGFDDGIYNELVSPNCIPLVIQECEQVDGGYYSWTGAPNYLEDCDCFIGCCLVDNALYINGEIPYLGPADADGGIYSTGCTFYDNLDYDHDPAIATCTLDDGTLEQPPSIVTASEGFYDRILPDCEPCAPSSAEIPVVPCPVTPVRVNLDEVFDDLLYNMRPDISNALTPLRLWKNRILTVTDEVPGAGTDRYNFLVADENKGPDPEDAYRYFVRLPIEYERNGPEWNKAVAVCNNQGYFSAPPSLAQTANDPPVIRPVLFDEDYYNINLPDFTTFYEEGYLISTSRIAEQEPVQEGFADSSISFERVEDIPFAYAAVTEYDGFEQRIPFANGDWRGEYYVFGTNESPLSSFITNDTADERLEQLALIDAPVSDMSRIKRPNVEFPDSIDQAAIKDYVVSYAYFSADYSASDDPVFDPDNTICWREQLLTCKNEVKYGTASYMVKVAAKTIDNPYYGQGSPSAFYINGEEAPLIQWKVGEILRFDQSHASNVDHPLRFYLQADKQTEYIDGVTIVGTPGSSGAHVTLRISEATPSALYYQCGNHAYMGYLGEYKLTCEDSERPSRTAYLLHSSITTTTNGTQNQSLTTEAFSTVPSQTPYSGQQQSY